MKNFQVNESTSGCLRRLHRVDEIGEVKFVRGYLRLNHGIKVNSVMVHGTEGTVRFDGFSWGYGGEGPRGLQELFNKLNIPQYQRDFVQSHEWVGWSGEPREYWRVNLDKPSHLAKVA